MLKVLVYFEKVLIPSKQKTCVRFAQNNTLECFLLRFHMHVDGGAFILLHRDKKLDCWTPARLSMQIPSGSDIKSRCCEENV